MSNARGKSRRMSAFRKVLPVFVKILLAALVCDGVVMALLELLPMNRLWKMSVNLFLLAGLMTPLIYRFLVKPVRAAAERSKRAEEKTNALKQRYESLIRNIPDCVYSALPDETGTTTFMADRWEEWTGYSPEDFYRDPETWPKSIHPEDRAGAVEPYIKACKDKKEYVSEYRVVHKDTGEIRHLRDHGMPVKDESGNVVQIDGIVTDITERVQIEERLSESEQRFRSLFESSQDGILAYDTGFRHTMWNQAMEKISGFTADEMIGKVPWEVCPFLEEVGEADAIRNTVQGKATVRPAQPYEVLETGRRGFFESAHFPLYDAEGRITGGMAVIRDVTDRKRAEKEIQDLARFASENPAPMLRIAADGTVLYANETAQPLLAARASGTDQAAPPEWRELVDTVLASDTKQVTEVEQGERVFVFSVVPVPEAGYVNLYGADVTELRQKEEQLRQSAKMEAIGRLAGGVAHDFNNYLAAITGYTALLLEDISPDARCRKDLEQIARAAESAAQLTKQLLAFGRKAIVRPLVVNLNSIISEMANPLGR
ncbi:MAG: PAS domain S-box protein, partial [Planctomycetes bacterium]|nr:PAS domain S-box protein [Planctomycetota bacterium]